MAGLRILCIGDSITAGIGGTVGNSYPDVLLDRMSKKFDSVTVINEGRPGDSTRDYYNYLKNTTGTVNNLEEIIGWFKPEIAYDVITIMLGANDCRTDNWVETEESLNFLEGIIEMVRPWVQKEKDIIMCSNLKLADPMPPRIVGGAHKWYQNRIEEELNPGIKALSEKMGLGFFDMYGVFKKGLDNGLELYDGIHPYNEGYRLMGEAISKHLIKRFS